MGKMEKRKKLYEETAKEIRRTCLKMAFNANSSHSGGALSMADFLSVLYSGVMNISPESIDDEDRDRLILSKGHTCAALYAVLAIRGFIDKEDLICNYGKNGTQYFTHVSHHIKGVEVSSGSLGHGLPIACGIALSAKIKGLPYKTYCICGDGEMDEGSCWEAILFAAHNHLDSLCIIIDYNKIQSLGNVKDICGLDPFVDKFKAFNCNVIEIDGHDVMQIEAAFDCFKNNVNHQPTVIIAHTIKGKGVSFMENQLAWHYKSPNTEQLAIALNELS